MLTTTDTKQLFRLLATVSSPPPCPYFELLSGTGILTESRARIEIAQLITGSSGRTSTFAIASELSIDPLVVDRLLPTAAELTGWGRVGASTIIKTGEFESLKLQLKDELSKGVVSTADFCRRSRIDADLLRRLLPADHEGWLGAESVYGKGYYEDVKALASARLADVQVPVELVSLDSAAPVQFLRKVVADVLREGVVKGTLEGEKFVPDAYVQARHTALVDELQTDGLISAKTLLKERVVDPEAFVKKHVPEAVLLASHFVTPAFISQMKGSTLDSVRTKGWSDTKDPEKRLEVGDEKRLRQIVLKDLPELCEVAGVVVSKDLETGLQAKCRSFAREKAEIAWRRRSKEKPAAIKRQELTQLLGSGQFLISPALLSHFTNSLLPYAVSQFNDKYEQMRQAVLDSAKAIFVDKYHARFYIHLKGVEGIKDPSLKSRLAGDLLHYARDSGITAVEKLETVLIVEDPNVNLQLLNDLRGVLQQTGAGKPENCLKDIQRALRNLEADFPVEDALAKKKANMMEEINSQLQNSKDLSLALLSTLLLVLATKSEGVLKATGKYVPKLLKEVQGAGIVSDQHLALMERVKAAALGKSDLSGDEIAQLRNIGTRCVGVGTIRYPAGQTAGSHA
ncbi:hypothetical protein K440DRAFT_621212 [Wilcoxina mikolae CBS 423.85]|nr:hypothetical protein K440DRAFT_621212 [Wilcoxina mikolae CBS 423.85]